MPTQMATAMKNCEDVGVARFSVGYARQAGLLAADSSPPPPPRKWVVSVEELPHVECAVPRQLAS